MRRCGSWAGPGHRAWAGPAGHRRRDGDGSSDPRLGAAVPRTSRRLAQRAVQQGDQCHDPEEHQDDDGQQAHHAGHLRQEHVQPAVRRRRLGRVAERLPRGEVRVHQRRDDDHRDGEACHDEGARAERETLAARGGHRGRLAGPQARMVRNTTVGEPSYRFSARRASAALLCFSSDGGGPVRPPAIALAPQPASSASSFVKELSQPCRARSSSCSV